MPTLIEARQGADQEQELPSGDAGTPRTGDDLARIEQALGAIEVVGERYPASHQNLINR